MLFELLHLVLAMLMQLQSIRVEVCSSLVNERLIGQMLAVLMKKSIQLVVHYDDVY